MIASISIGLGSSGAYDSGNHGGTSSSSEAAEQAAEQVADAASELSNVLATVAALEADDAQAVTSALSGLVDVQAASAGSASSGNAARNLAAAVDQLARATASAVAIDANGTAPPVVLSSPNLNMSINVRSAAILTAAPIACASSSGVDAAVAMPPGLLEGISLGGAFAGQGSDERRLRRLDASTPLAAVLHTSAVNLHAPPEPSGGSSRRRDRRQLPSDAESYSEDGDTSPTNASMSPIVSFSLQYLDGTALPIRNAASPINISIPFTSSGHADMTIECRWWSEADGNWSTAGCATVLDAAGSTVCACDHLTEFIAFEFPTSAEDLLATALSSTAMNSLSSRAIECAFNPSRSWRTVPAIWGCNFVLLAVFFGLLGHAIYNDRLEIRHTLAMHHAKQRGEARARLAEKAAQRRQMIQERAEKLRHKATSSHVKLLAKGFGRTGEGPRRVSVARALHLSRARQGEASTAVGQHDQDDTHHHHGRHGRVNLSHLSQMMRPRHGRPTADGTPAGPLHHHGPCCCASAMSRLHLRRARVGHDDHEEALPVGLVSNRNGTGTGTGALVGTPWVCRQVGATSTLGEQPQPTQERTTVDSCVSAARVQASLRGRLARSRLQMQRVNEDEARAMSAASRTIQAHIRGLRARQHAKGLVAARRLQCQWRLRASRRQLKRAVNRCKLLRALQIDAISDQTLAKAVLMEHHATRLQAQLRAQLTRRHLAEERAIREAMETATLAVQRQLRGMQVRRHALRHLAARRLQRQYRVHLSRASLRRILGRRHGLAEALHVHASILAMLGAEELLMANVLTLHEEEFGPAEPLPMLQARIPLRSALARPPLRLSEPVATSLRAAGLVSLPASRAPPKVQTELEAAPPPVESAASEGSHCPRSPQPPADAASAAVSLLLRPSGGRRIVSGGRVQHTAAHRIQERWRTAKTAAQTDIITRRWHKDVDRVWKRMCLACTSSHTLCAGIFHRGAPGYTRAQTVMVLINSFVFELVLLCLFYTPPAPSADGAPMLTINIVGIVIAGTYAAIITIPIMLTFAWLYEPLIFVRIGGWLLRAAVCWPCWLGRCCRGTRGAKVGAAAPAVAPLRRNGTRYGCRRPPPSAAARSAVNESTTDPSSRAPEHTARVDEVNDTAVFRAIDADGDGKLSVDEIASVTDLLDADGDGVVSQQEMAAMLGDDVVFDNQTGAWKVEDVGEEQQLGGVPTRCHVPDDTECDRWFGAMWTAHTPQPTVPPKAVSWRQGAIPVSLRFSCLEPGSRFLATSLEDPSTGNLAAPAWRVPPCRQPQSPPPSPPEPPSLSRLQSAASRGRLVGGWTRARLRDSASIDTETEGRSVGWVAHPTQALRRSDDRVVSRALAFNIGSSVTTVARTMRWQARSVREPGAGSRMTRLARRQFAYTSLNEVLLKASLTHSWDRRDWCACSASPPPSALRNRPLASRTADLSTSSALAQARRRQDPLWVGRQPLCILRDAPSLQSLRM